MSRTIQWCDGPTPSASRRRDGVHRECLAGQGDRVLRLQRHDGGAEFDPRWCGRHQRHHRQRVEVVGHLRHPRGVHARGLGPLDVGDQLGDLARHVAALGPDHHAESHAPTRHVVRRIGDVALRTLGAGSCAPVGQRPHVADQRRPAACRSGTPPRHRRPAASARRPAGWCRRRRRRCRPRRRPAARRRPAWSARRARRTGSKARPAQRPPAARSTRCPRCAAGCRCR